MHFIIPAIFVAALVYYLITMALDFVSEPGTLWQRLLAAGKGSATKLWAKIVAVISAVLGAVASAADFFNAPQVSQAIQQYAKPEWVAGIMVGIMIITEIARNRTLK